MPSINSTCVPRSYHSCIPTIPTYSTVPEPRTLSCFSKMKITSIIFLAWSVAARAAPFLNGLSANNDNAATHDSGHHHGKHSPASPATSITQNECSAQGGIQACCDGFAPSCLVQILGSSCNTESYCCDSEESVVSELPSIDNVQSDLGAVRTDLRLTQFANRVA